MGGRWSGAYPLRTRPGAARRRERGIHGDQAPLHQWVSHTARSSRPRDIAASGLAGAGGGWSRRL